MNTLFVILLAGALSGANPDSVVSLSGRVIGVHETISVIYWPETGLQPRSETCWFRYAVLTVDVVDAFGETHTVTSLQRHYDDPQQHRYTWGCVVGDSIHCEYGLETARINTLHYVGPPGGRDRRLR